ncbi:MAG TPA: PEP-CTERM sorting domain-containing protein, partial [Lacipirellula sp.]
FANPGTRSNHIAQTFTSGAAGLLSRIDLQLYRYPEASAPPTVQIRSTTGGVPDAGPDAVLFETTVDVSSLPFAPGFDEYVEPTSFDVSSAGIMVDSGDVLAISFQGGSFGYPDWTLWSGNYGTDTYDAGSRFHRTSSSQPWNPAGDELSFRTWVDLNPAPPGEGVGSYTLFETALATPDDPVSNSGSSVDDGFFPGIGFRVQRTTQISQVGAYLSGSGSVFAAIVELEDDNQYSLPNPYDLSGDDVLGTTLLELPPGFDGADVTGDLSLTLEPGAYALILGSGKFGADGDALLRSKHTPNGRWTPYVIRQSDGARFFNTGDRRLFVVADSAPGTVQIRPTVDVLAEVADNQSVFLTEGEDDILVKTGNEATDPDQLAVLEFSLDDVPAGRAIERVTLELDLNLITHSGPLAFDVFGFAGDGAAQTSDALGLATIVGTTSFDDLGVVSVDLDPTFVESLVGSASHLGLTIAPGATGNFRFGTLEGGEFSEPALLTVNLAPVTPGDFDGDGDVDGDDLAQWRGDFGASALSDADGDGDSDGADFLAWQRQLGSGAALSAAAAGVPEPSATALLTLALAALLAAKRRTAAIC